MMILLIATSTVIVVICFEYPLVVQSLFFAPPVIGSVLRLENGCIAPKIEAPSFLCPSY